MTLDISSAPEPAVASEPGPAVAASAVDAVAIAAPVPDPLFQLMRRMPWQWREQQLQSRRHWRNGPVRARPFVF